MYRYQSYKLSYICTQIELIRNLFNSDRLQLTQSLWDNSLCKLVRKNERALFKETTPYLLVAILSEGFANDDTKTLAEFDRLQSAYPNLILSQSVEFEQRQEVDEIANW